MTEMYRDNGIPEMNRVPQDNPAPQVRDDSAFTSGRQAETVARSRSVSILTRVKRFHPTAST